jgi:hypothetical protein
MRPGRIRKAAIILKPATLTKIRRALLSRNYHRLFSLRRNAKPGPKSPSDDLARVIVELKRRNARFGCPRIAQQINKAFGVNIDFLMPSPLEVRASAAISTDSLIDHPEAQKCARKRHCREEIQAVVAA